MEELTKQGLKILKFEEFSQFRFLQHFFTTRKGGVSENEFESLNLSFTRGDDEAKVRENFRRVALAMGAKEDRFVFTDQTHTAIVGHVTEEDAGKGLTRERDYHDVDALITDTPGIVLSAFFADCVPLFFVDPVRKAIGLAHSGWRGTVNRIGAAVVGEMEDTFGTKPKDLYAAIGPAICQDCYEVGEEVAIAFRDEFPEDARALLRPMRSPGKEGKFQLDLWYANEVVLSDAGVPFSQIEVANQCTCCNPKKFFSHRASGGKRGNLGAFMMIRA